MLDCTEVGAPGPASSANAQAQAYLAGWFEAWSAPAILIAPTTVLIAANDRARRIIEAGEEFKLSDGRLSLSHRSQTEALRAFIGTLNDAPRVWTLPRSGQDGFWVVRAQKLSVEGGEAIVGLVLNSTVAPPSRIWADLAVPFLLTPAEDRVARHLFEGLTAGELAAEMQISLETARTYIRRIYLKTGASSREKLLTLLSPFQST